MSRFLKKLVILVVGLMLQKEAYADKNNFFELNVSRHIFSGEVVLKPAERYQHFKKVNLESAKHQVNPEELSADLKKLSPAEEVVAEYGDPSISQPVLAKEDAPKPFRAMMAAMQKGEDKLAYEYAKQYVRYIQDLNHSNMRAVGLSQLAMVREGLIAESDVINSVSPKDKELLNQDIKNQLKAEEVKTYLSNLSPETKSLLLKAHQGVLEEDNSLFEKEKLNLEAEQRLAEEERFQRYKARLELNRKHIPIDPEGKVDVLFFFNAEQINSLKMSPVIEALFRESEEDEGFNLIAYSLAKIDADREANFRRITNANFPIQEAAQLARALGIKQAPATVIISQTTGESIVEVGSRSFFYLDELVRKMQGKKSGGLENE
ncbi:MAG: hypothetical protein KDD56_07490 [Bdellovibrionales bacterium]|nr:hypothetical protein [Bdellovibrionales bacterium]